MMTAAAVMFSSYSRRVDSYANKGLRTFPHHVFACEYQSTFPNVTLNCRESLSHQLGHMFKGKRNGSFTQYSTETTAWGCIKC